MHMYRQQPLHGLGRQHLPGVLDPGAHPAGHLLRHRHPQPVPTEPRRARPRRLRADPRRRARPARRTGEPHPRTRPGDVRGAVRGGTGLGDTQRRRLGLADARGDDLAVHPRRARARSTSDASALRRRPAQPHCPRRRLAARRRRTVPRRDLLLTPARPPPPTCDPAIASRPSRRRSARSRSKRCGPTPTRSSASATSSRASPRPRCRRWPRRSASTARTGRRPTGSRWLAPRPGRTRIRPPLRALALNPLEPLAASLVPSSHPTTRWSLRHRRSHGRPVSGRAGPALSSRSASPYPPPVRAGCWALHDRPLALRRAGQPSHAAGDDSTLRCDDDD